MLLVPGVVEARVAEAEADVRPVLASLAQTIQPFLALVLTVAVRGVGLLVTLPLESVPRASVLPLRAKEKTAGTVAVTTIWSSVMLAVAYDSVSMGASPEVRVVTLPRLEAVAPDLTATAAVLIQLKQ